MAATREDVIEFLKGMTLLEASQLVKELEETFGVSAAGAAAPPAGPAATATAAAADTPHLSSSILASSAASRTVSVERSSTIFARSAINKHP